MHVVPRWKGDTNFMPVIGDTRVLPGEPRGHVRNLRDGVRASRRTRRRSTRHLQGLRRRGTVSGPDRRGRRLSGRRGPSPGCSPTCAGEQRAPDRCTSAVGHDMRLALPRARGAFRSRPRRRGLPRARHREVGTEMVYYAVGSRELDGGVSVTASHNPKAVGRLQARARGCDRRCRATAASRTCSRVVEREDFSRARGGGQPRASRGHLRGVPAPRARLHRPGGDPPDEGGARRRQRDGRAR